MLKKRASCAVELIGEHRQVVEALRDALLAQDELVGDEITDVIAGAHQIAATIG